MRLFVAVELDTKTKDRLVALQTGLEAFDSKLVEKDNLHLTLKFLGTVDESEVHNVATRLAAVKVRQFKVILSKSGVSPSEDEPRVIWVGGEENVELDDLKKAVNKALPGFKQDLEVHESHITLARIKSLESDEYDKLFSVLDKIDDEISGEPIEFDVKGFTLFQSTLTKKGPIYERIPLKKQ